MTDLLEWTVYDMLNTEADAVLNLLRGDVNPHEYEPYTEINIATEHQPFTLDRPFMATPQDAEAWARFGDEFK